MLDDLKVGDRVAIVYSRSFDRRIFKVEYSTVERVTKTQITAFGGRRFMKSTGLEFGAPHRVYSDKIEPVTDALLAAVRGSERINDAESKLSRWIEILRKTRGGDAVALADMLPEPPKENTDA